MGGDELIRVVEVFSDVEYERFFITRIICRLEDGRIFVLERVPFDIILGLKRIRGEEIGDDRERFVDILLSMPNVIEMLGKHLDRVIINEIDHETGVYSALAEFSDGEMIIRRKMVPSHAIFLAVLTGKPIFVRRGLVDEQEEYMNRLIEELGIEEESIDELDIDDDIVFLDEESSGSDKDTGF